MRRAGVVWVALALSGCLRVSFDRCAEVPPHPECAALAAGRDAAALDAAVDAAGSDVPTADAGSPDAGSPDEDAPSSDAP